MIILVSRLLLIVPKTDASYLYIYEHRSRDDYVCGREDWSRAGDAWRWSSTLMVLYMRKLQDEKQSRSIGDYCIRHEIEAQGYMEHTLDASSVDARMSDMLSRPRAYVPFLVALLRGKGDRLTCHCGTPSRGIIAWLVIFEITVEWSHHQIG
jgi:hypothetical protein